MKIPKEYAKYINSPFKLEQRKGYQKWNTSTLEWSISFPHYRYESDLLPGKIEKDCACQEIQNRIRKFQKFSLFSYSHSSSPWWSWRSFISAGEECLGYLTCFGVCWQFHCQLSALTSWSPPSQGNPQTHFGVKLTTHNFLSPTILINFFSARKSTILILPVFTCWQFRNEEQKWKKTDF